MEQFNSGELPKDFQVRMKHMLKDETEDFLSSYDRPRTYGLRWNPLKMNEETFLGKMPFSLDKISWAKEGYYYDPKQQPGKHPFHEAGAYYIQEPSAMAVVEILDPKPGETILDLCGAPGGKTTQIAGRMAGQGLLVSNEIVPGRAAILSQNVERMGIRNAVVLNETPEQLSQHFPCFFDRIVVDAPCSGEGMFHKDPGAVKEWSLQQVQVCAQRQKDILTEAVTMLKPGGILVYSTCTFAPEEDEQIAEWLIGNFPEYEIEDTHALQLGLSKGRPEWAMDVTLEYLDKTARIWPHKQHGEGHFIARFKKAGSLVPTAGKNITETGKGKNKQEDWKEYELFISQTLKGELPGKKILFGEQVYLIPEGMTQLKGCKVIRPGLHMGTNKKNRFEPAHELAMALHPDEVVQSYEVKDPRPYFRGETVACSAGIKGWVLVTWQNLSIGWGKADRGILKNHYPKGLRVDMKDYFS